MSPAKNVFMDLFRSKFTSAKYLNSLPKCRIADDFPTCLAPRINRGFRIGLSFHASNWRSMFLAMYSFIILKH